MLSTFFRINYSIIAFGLILAWYASQAKSEFYSSIHEMSRVYAYEAYMLQQMRKIIADNESKLDFLQARLREYERDREEARAAGTEFFESPLNQYLHTKRLTVDWQRVHNLMADHTGKKALKRMQQLRERKRGMPDVREYEGAIDGLLRLQYIYRLKAKDLAAGHIDGVNYDTQLNAQHCFEIAKIAARDERPLLAHAWLKEALKRLETAPKTRDTAHAKANVLALLEEIKLKKLGDLQHFNGTNIDAIADHAPIPDDLTQLEDFERYRYTCNGLIKQTPTEERRLRCGYLTETHAFLLIAPIKVEELNHDPLLVIYHDVIADSEIETVKQLVQNSIERATVIGSNNSVVSNVRTSQFTFLPKSTHKVLQTIDIRVADMTNLNMNYAEDHQFANYGIGGHYAQHMDWFYPLAFETNQVSSQEMGNRIATVLFYLSDVEQGGGTAFPFVKRLLMPKKGAAAFWYNLHASGDGDVRSMHGACPIIVGSKWVLNRWIREYIQSDRRPCELWNDSLVR